MSFFYVKYNAFVMFKYSIHDYLYNSFYIYIER